jgi:hypothetical protein
MSLVVAAHNDRDIVIGSESLSTTTKTGARQADYTVEKVVRLNQRLALMITGRYVSDKFQFIANYQRSVSTTLDLDEAFQVLFEQAGSAMTIHPGEGFGIGLAGYHDDKPGFKLITQEHGKGMGYVKDYPFSYFLSGDQQPVQLAESLITSSVIPSGAPTDEIEATIRRIIGTCIERYPATLGGQVNVLMLS